MTDVLTPARSSALLDILTHTEVYSEIRFFRQPKSLDHYGPPFTKEAKTQSSSPALQSLVANFLLDLPGLKDVPQEWWTVQIREIIVNMQKANLSESYDKGSVGSRKTLSTAVSSLIEYPVRGTFGGFAEIDDPDDKYDLQSADDLSRGFRNFVDQAIYGSVLDDLVKKAAETDKLEEHSNQVKTVHEFVLVNLASFMHYTLILSPKGQYILKLVENANKLIPYMAIRQTLKIGNIATMISALVKLILAKMSVASITNYIGLTDTQDDGMNLLQQVISTVLSWDIRDLESRVSKIEKDKQCPSKDVRSALDEYVQAGAEKQEELRRHSQTSSNSIVLVILADAGKPSDLDEDTHRRALDYLSCKISIRDRKEIIRVGCHSRPDHLTTMVRSLVNAYEPIIRRFHAAVDLSDTVADLQNFIIDLLKVGKMDGKSNVPTVGDFCILLRKHQFASHKFIHQLCKNGREVTGWYLEWAKSAASKFRRESSFIDASESQEAHGEDSADTFESPRDAGDLTKSLGGLFTALPPETQKKIIPILDGMVLYIDEMHASSTKRLADVLHSAPTNTSTNASITKKLGTKLTLSRPNSRSSSPARAAIPSKDAQAQTQSTPSNASHDNSSDIPKVSSDPGPGAYLARWQDLLDSTPITPLTTHGKPHHASDKVIVEKSAEDVDGGKTADFGTTQKTLDSQKVMPNVQGGGTEGKKSVVKKPDVNIVVSALSQDFRKLLAERSLYW